MEQTVSDRYRQRLLETFRAFVKFCDEHGLWYCVCAGTCIGAVRHHGLIPWDDDIDVFMKRSDYDRLVEMRDSLPAGYKLIAMDEDGYTAPIPKFCNTNTTLWEDKSLETVIGIYVDIFPLDECSEDVAYCERLKKKYERSYIKYQDGCRKWTISDMVGKLKGLHALGFLRMLRNSTVDRLLRDYHRKRYDKIHGMIMSMKGPNMTGFDGLYARVYPKDFFESDVECEFEGMRVKIPCRYDDYLRMTYGDYMTPPPEHKRVSTHSHYFLDLDKGLTMEEVKEKVAAGTKMF